jgi:hypothetical protein
MAMSDIRTRPATDAYRNNFPFPERRRQSPEEIAGEMPDTITYSQCVFVIASSLPEARQRYMMNLGGKGYESAEAADKDRTNKKDEIWEIGLQIRCVRR